MLLPLKVDIWIAVDKDLSLLWDTLWKNFMDLI